MSSQLSNNNNNYTIASAFSNLYISRKLNNMDQAQVMKKEREDWMRLYHKTLKGIEAMIDVQRMMKDMKKIAEEMNTTVTEMEGTILTASINNQTTNATNITQMVEDLWYLVQSDMDKQVFQIQRMLANKLDQYKGKGNNYVDENFQKIQDLYIEEGVQDKGKRRVKEEKVILIKPYKASESTLTKSSSFINKEIDNLLKHMKFVKFPTQTRIFWPPPHYQLLCSRGEQDPDFWKEVVTALVDNKNNMETSRNRYTIKMFQGGPSHEPFFIAIDNQDQVIISPNKKTVTMYVVGELEVLI